jgi:hypothetical protein
LLKQSPASLRQLDAALGNNPNNQEGNIKMRSRLFLSLLGAVALLATSAAQAGTLTSATWVQVTQGFPLTRSTAGYCPPTTPGCAPLLAGGTSTMTSIAVGLTYPAFSTKFFVPKSPNGSIDLAVNITQGGSASIAATPAMASVTAGGVLGTAFVMSGVHNTKGVNQSTFLTGVNTIVMVSLNAGVPGQFTGSFIVIGINHLITVDFYKWTPGVASFTGLTSKGVALPNSTASGSFNLTAMGGGTVTLVSPSKISIDCSLAQRRTAGFTSLTMHFVPEPGTLLLIGAGALGLVLVGSRKS